LKLNRGMELTFWGMKVMEEMGLRLVFDGLTLRPLEPF
jgi:hypothetical protein